MQIFSLCFLFFIAHCVVSPGVLGFSATPPTLTSRPTAAAWTRYASSEGDAGQHQDDAVNDMIARRIIVTGDVQGGYYRSCVLNEAGRFRRLVGTMTPPDDTKKAEIYVEGKRNMVEGFVRWCKKGNVGLSQVTAVEDVVEEDPTGLYEGFYIQTH